MTDTNHIEVLQGFAITYDAQSTIGQAFRAAITALSARASAGEGGVWVMVPREPTAWMRNQLANEVCRQINNDEPTDAAKIYATMLTAAPQPAQAGASGGGDGWWEGLGNEVIDGEACILYQHTTTGAQLWCRKSEHEKVDALLKGLTTPASPATEQGGVSVESVRRALASYHLQFTEHDEDGPQSLFDALTPPGDVDIGRGIKELGLLADYVAAELSTPQPAAAQGDELVIVPRKLTNAMQIAGLAALDESDATPESIGHLIGYKAIRESYAAMLAAAPQPQEASAQGEIVAIVGERGSVSWRSERILPVGAPLYSTPPAHGDGEGDIEAAAIALANHDRKHPNARAYWDWLHDDEKAKFRSKARAVLSATRPTPEAQEARDAARYRWLREKADIEDVFYGDRVKLAIPAPDIDGFNDLNDVIDAALALPAQGEG